MNYNAIDYEKFSDWQQVLAETNKSLSYEQCLKIKKYIDKYQEACISSNPNHVMPKSFQDASNRLNERIQHHESVKKPFVATYVIPVLSGILGAVVGALVTYWLTTA
ncbi:TPA: hypothetical protein ACGUU3_000008 [Vibrio vulnificus]